MRGRFPFEPKKSQPRKPYYKGVSMLSQTTLNAIQTLLLIVLEKRDGPISPGEIAAELDASHAYIAKINTQLVKANILRSHRGAKGGVTLERTPQDITLLEVVEACQGKILGDYCQEHDNTDEVCAFHVAMHQLQKAIIDVLSKWTIRDLADKPMPIEALRKKVNCRMACSCRKLEGARN